MTFLQKGVCVNYCLIFLFVVFFVPDNLVKIYYYVQYVSLWYCLPFLTFIAYITVIYINTSFIVVWRVSFLPRQISKISVSLSKNEISSI